MNFTFNRTFLSVQIGFNICGEKTIRINNNIKQEHAQCCLKAISKHKSIYTVKWKVPLDHLPELYWVYCWYCGWKLWIASVIMSFGFIVSCMDKWEWLSFMCGYAKRPNTNLGHIHQPYVKLPLGYWKLTALLRNGRVHQSCHPVRTPEIFNNNQTNGNFHQSPGMRTSISSHRIASHTW